AVELIKKIRPDVYVKGNDYADADKDECLDINLEREAVESVGGKIHFTQEITFSSSSLLNEYFEVYSKPVQNFLKNFRKRYSADKVIESLRNLKKMRVLLIGETILDEYHYVAAIGKPPKGDHIAAKFIRGETHAGGILACANHIANFCGSVDLITAIGNQDFMEKEAFVRASLKSNINLHLFFHPTAPTIVKRRYVNQTFLNKLFEIYVIDDRPSLELETKILAQLKKIFSDKKIYDLVLVLDYGHGLLTPVLIDCISNQNCFLAVNAQTNTANAGYNPITKYRRANYFCLDEPELRLAFRDKDNDINQILTRLVRNINLPGAITVTRGHLGSITYDVANKTFFEAPVLSQKIVDTTGAGDAFLAITAPCVASGIPMDLIPFIGNAVGALAVGYLGNRSSIEEEPLYKFITALLK
ncbi:MAG: PfkB family carbohydrate kinase, partial [Patescibacteria group bacterium]